MRARAGSTLLELLTSLVLLGLVAAACAGLIRTQSLLLRQVSERAAAAEALRAGHAILRAEVQDLLATDLRWLARDSIGLRVFRGLGIVCSSNGPRVTLRYLGVRQPDPAKDSLLVAGSEQAGTIRLLSSRTDPCATRAGEQLVALEPDSAIRNDAVVLFFESGSYHLAQNALRYRRGASGLQPITDDFIDHSRSGFALTSGGALSVSLRSATISGVPPQQSASRISMRNQ